MKFSKKVEHLTTILNKDLTHLALNWGTLSDKMQSEEPNTNDIIERLNMIRITVEQMEIDIPKLLQAIEDCNDTLGAKLMENQILFKGKVYELKDSVVGESRCKLCDLHQNGYCQYHSWGDISCDYWTNFKEVKEIDK